MNIRFSQTLALDYFGSTEAKSCSKTTPVDKRKTIQWKIPQHNHPSCLKFKDVKFFPEFYHLQAVMVFFFI